VTRNDVETFLISKGYRAPRAIFPHLFYKEGQEDKRYRMTDLGLRYESRLSNGEWVRIRSAYYKNLSINAEGKLAGMTMRGM
jgi:hypothetical protein